MKRMLAVAFTTLLLSGAGAAAQDYPSQSVRIIVPFSPGGVVDIAARVLGEALAEDWGQQVIVENRTGGSGFIAATAVAQAKPDGHTLLMAESGVSAINPSLFAEIPYDMKRDFKPISTVSDTPLVLVAGAGVPFDSTEAFVEAAKKEPGKLIFASAGNGTLNHLAGEWIAQEADIDIRHVPYRGGAPAATAIAGGEAHVGVLALSSVRPFVDDGTMKILAVARKERVASQPDVPTLAEGGIPNVDPSQWTGLFAPSGVPDEIIQKLNKDVVAALGQADVQEKFAKVGAETVPSTPEEFSALIDRLSGQFKTLIEAANIKPN